MRYQHPAIYWLTGILLRRSEIMFWYMHHAEIPAWGTAAFFVVKFVRMSCSCVSGWSMQN